MRELEQIVQRLEDTQLPLEEALTLFEKGIKLSRCCSKKLDEAQKRIDILMKEEGGTVVQKPFAEYTSDEE